MPAELATDSRVWMPVLGYEGHYEVSEDGLVRSLTRVDRTGRPVKGRLLRPQRQPEKPYTFYHLARDGRRRRLALHFLLLGAFVGPRPDGGDEIRHLDGDGTNNALSNLRYGTRSENRQDSVRHGTHTKAAQTHCAYGHEFTTENIYCPPGATRRVCRQCRRDRPKQARDARVEVDGVLVAVDAKKHGSIGTYTNKSCRCRLCSDAWDAAQRRRRETGRYAA